MTFAELDRQRGFTGAPSSSVETFPLPSWYTSVRDIPFSEFGEEDICKACRQQIYPEHIVPIALELMKFNLLEGEMYAGELLVSLKSVPLNYWKEHSHQRSELVHLLEGCVAALPADVVSDAKELLSFIRGNGKA
jgi:hypothetical protein